MKIQLFTLAAVTSLACATAASAQTVVTTNVKPINLIDVNTAVNKVGGIQGAPQSIMVAPTQNSAIVAAPAAPAPAKSIGGYTIPQVAQPKVIVNTNVTPTSEIQVNTAVLSSGVTQGGNQTTTVTPTQNGLVSGRGADGAYIYNYNYVSNYQKQFNNAYYSNGIKQGGGQDLTVTPTLTGTAK